MDYRRTKTQKRNPIIIRLTHKRVSTSIPTKIKLKPEEWVGEHHSNYEYSGTWRYFDKDGKMVKTVIYEDEPDKKPKPKPSTDTIQVNYIILPPQKTRTFYFSGYTEESDPFIFSQKDYLKSAIDDQRDE